MDRTRFLWIYFSHQDFKRNLYKCMHLYEYIYLWISTIFLLLKIYKHFSGFQCWREINLYEPNSISCNIFPTQLSAQLLIWHFIMSQKSIVLLKNDNQDDLMSAPHVHSSIYMISICCYGPSSILRQYSDVSRSYCKNSSKEIALQFNFGFLLFIVHSLHNQSFC